MPRVAEREHLPIREARAGDPEAWDIILRRYQLPLYSYVMQLVRDEPASADITQEVFISALRNIGGLRDDDRLGSWLFGISHQKCIQHWRRSNRARTFQEQASESSEEVAESPLDLLIREEEEAEIMKLLEQIPLAQRSVLLLHVLEDFSLEEISRIIESPLGTVKSRLHYAKRALRNLIRHRRDDLGARGGSK